MNTLYNSFLDHTSVETLDSKFKYHAEGFGPQDARRRVTFQSLPTVLHLDLKRHKYGIQPDAMVKVWNIYPLDGLWYDPNPATKINNRFKFPFEIDLDEFLDETADRTKPWKYKLHSVIVHSGDIYDGHYFAFVKPDQHTRWLKFDDERVTPVADREVLEENYGGEPPNSVVPRTRRDQVGATNKSTNACMLVYIRETEIDRVLAPLNEEDIPPHLSTPFQGCCSEMFGLSHFQNEDWMRIASRWRRRKERNSTRS